MQPVVQAFTAPKQLDKPTLTIPKADPSVGRLQSVEDRMAQFKSGNAAGGSASGSFVPTPATLTPVQPQLTPMSLTATLNGLQPPSTSSSYVAPPAAAMQVKPAQPVQMRQQSVPMKVEKKPAHPFPAL